MMQQPARSLHATNPTRGDFNSTCSAALTAQATRLHGVRGKKDHASASMQSGIHTSPGLFATVSAMVTRRRKTSRSLLPARASLKLAKLAQAMLDVFAGSFWLLYVALWIVVILGILPFTLFCLVLIQF